MSKILQTIKILASTALTMSTALACESTFENGLSFSVQSLPTRYSGCNVRVSTNQISRVNQRARTYGFSSTGMFQIVDTYSAGRNSRTTGTRAFYFFPRRQEPTFQITGGGIIVTNSSGNQFQFSNRSSRLSSISGIQFTEHASIARTNQGAVRIVQSQQLVLDVGYQFGGVAYRNRTNNSVFMNSRNQRCAVPNSEVFDYSGRDPQLRFATDEALHTFLSQRCPQLDLTSLLPATANSSEEGSQSTVPTPVAVPATAASLPAIQVSTQPTPAVLPGYRVYYVTTEDTFDSGATADDAAVSNSIEQHTAAGVENIGGVYRSSPHDMDAGTADPSLPATN